ncbi:hypothetical protein MMC07_007785 [Pseudocyphellaria aurata]|nr:hypothetical protein [Pseudocyphellaria aurata]
MATNETLLDSIRRGPNHEPQSFLEGLFNPSASYEPIIATILGQLSNDDHNAMRRASRKMNNGLMALRNDDGTLIHDQRLLRDRCDTAWCANPVDCHVRLRRCTRRKHEWGFIDSRSRDHSGIKSFLICTNCRLKSNSLEPIRKLTMGAQWPLCTSCTQTKERQYPHGAQFCQCWEEFSRKVLCPYCVWSREKFRREMKMIPKIARKIGPDASGGFRAAKLHRPSNTRLGCPGCGMRDRPKLSTEDRLRSTRLCVVCQKYIIVPTRPARPNAKPIGPPRELAQPNRRSARLDPYGAQAFVPVRLSYTGSVRNAETELQNTGVPDPSPPPPEAQAPSEEFTQWFGGYGGYA